MTFDPTDTGPDAARAALHASRHALRKRVAVLQAQPDAVFIDAFAVLVAEVEAGFRREETLLDRIGDLCLRTRRADAAVILRALHRVTPAIERGDVALGREVAAALGAVLAMQRSSEPQAMARPAQPPGWRMRHRTMRLRPS